ncbi:hypothetical protein BDV95DRAFT_268834 [Massariosphaeria phaeospora]|uniref:Secreted protein n=1 Tax=Massariosphaeria phaeospora TaxID=100035 RepID=A0A7C8LZS7_9PLEO|nr:hypothetical protein BDV95DRAFT_268834 [Massariosphaeria phaeospora]
MEFGGTVFSFSLFCFRFCWCVLWEGGSVHKRIYTLAGRADDGCWIYIYQYYVFDMISLVCCRPRREGGEDDDWGCYSERGQVHLYYEAPAAVLKLALWALTSKDWRVSNTNYVLYDFYL